MAAKKKSNKANGKGEKPVTKTGFIRTLPESTPADDVVAKAKEAGL